jgi:hypothetical protein
MDEMTVRGYKSRWMEAIEMDEVCPFSLRANLHRKTVREGLSRVIVLGIKQNRWGLISLELHKRPWLFSGDFNNLPLLASDSPVQTVALSRSWASFINGKNLNLLNDIFDWIVVIESREQEKPCIQCNDQPKQLIRLCGSCECDKLRTFWDA